MTGTWRTVEHWVAGPEDDPMRHDLWLRQAFDVWVAGWAVQYRRGGRGKPVDHRHYPDEATARAAAERRRAECSEMYGGADWRLVADEGWSAAPL